jgi:hypothetical protein
MAAAIKSTARTFFISLPQKQKRATTAPMSLPVGGLRGFSFFWVKVGNRFGRQPDFVPRIPELKPD